MRLCLIGLSLLGLAGVVNGAAAQTSTVLIDGQAAKVSLTPPPAKSFAGSDVLGDDERAAILEQISKSKPMMATGTGLQSPEQLRP